MPIPAATPNCSRCDSDEETTRTVSTDECLCRRCFRTRFCNCGTCGAEVARDRDRCFEVGYSMYCGPCYDAARTPCHGCESPTSLLSIIHAMDGNSWCSCCYDEHFQECDECEETYNVDDLDSGYCTECRNATLNRWEHHGFFVEAPTHGELKSTRKFGVEIETSSCPDHPSIRTDTVFGCKPDGSVDGMEFVSPILYGDEGLAEVRKICGHARRLDWQIDSACGLHVHIDLTEETQADCFKLAYAYMHTYDFWTAFISDARKQNYYCAKHNYTDADILNYTNFDSWCHYASNGNRYDWCNWYAWLQHKTVELRHHTATLNGEKICNWIKAHTRFIDKVLTTPQVTLTRALAGRDVHAQSTTISEWWDDEALTDYYNGRAEHFHKPFRATTLVGA